MRGVIDMVDSLIVAPAPAMTVDYVRRHIKALSHSDDVLIANWIAAATQYFEEHTGRQTTTATWEGWLDRFPSACDFPGGWGAGTHLRIELPHPPLQSVISVQYVDADGTVQDVSDSATSPATPLWQVKAPSGPYARRGWVEPLHGLTWPIARHEGGAVRIRYTAGYGDTPDQVPELVMGLLAYLVGNFDQYRSSVAFRTGFADFPIGLQLLLDGFKYSAYPSRVLGSSGHRWGW